MFTRTPDIYNKKIEKKKNDSFAILTIAKTSQRTHTG